ncbi:MAG: MFS transporter [Holosporaceae bacterium]|jgi:MFS family permease|nr:MFS transporter [Holosporaceae bacterium]
MPFFSSSAKENPKNRFWSRSIWAIFIYGLTLSISTQMLYSQLALYLKYELKIGESRIALMDGFVEFVSYLVRICAGILSDYLRNRRLLMIVGCAILCLIKPIFAMTSSAVQVLWAEIAERLANGIQACPRDALIADQGPKKRLAAAFGLFKSLKTTGALLGAIASTAILHWSNYKILFWCAGIPALIAMRVLLCIDERLPKTRLRRTNPFQKKYLKSLDKRFWIILLLAGICELSHFGESLLILRTSAIVSPRLAGITAVFMCLGPALLSYPLGSAADRCGKIQILKLCLWLSIFSYLFMLDTNSPAIMFVGVFVLGGQQASLQSIFLSMIGECVNERLRATAIGLFYSLMGLSYMTASGICGQLWENHGHKYAFFYAMSICFLGLAALKFFPKTLRELQLLH